jgi:hypothetical protein
MVLLEENKVNILSTYSLAANHSSGDLFNVETCYRVIGDVVRIGQLILGSNLTDTASVREASEIGLIPEVLPASISQACNEFCNSLGLRHVLVKYLEQINKVFSNIINLSAEVDHFRDEQADNAPHVVIRVEVHSDQETALREYDQFVCWMSAEIPTSESHHFTTTVRRV